jgi:hypothetical protein
MKNGKRVTIFKAALEALQSSLDAHGHAVEPEDAWDFIINTWLDAGPERYNDIHALLDDGVENFPVPMPKEFRTDYKRLLWEYITPNGPIGGRQ